MNWFKKSSPANHENPHKQQKHKRVKKTDKSPTKLTKSQSLPLPPKKNEEFPDAKRLRMASCDNIEIVDPEIFFQDPEHVRNYKEEAIFLKIMSEWEIVENPSTRMDNFFSADFEDEFVNMKTQQQLEQLQQEQLQQQQQQQLSLTETEINNISTLEAATTQSSLKHESFAENDKTLLKKKSNRKRSHKRSLTELFFADKIKDGLLPPMKMSTSHTSLELITPPSSNPSSPQFLKKRRRLKGSSSSTISQNEDLFFEESLLNPTTCSIGIIKDCAINRSQLKTEALACSIMGAIGKCPGKDKTPGSSIKDLIRETGDMCHPINSCDHYDIKQFFRLDDNGNILLNMNHVEEIQGFGYPSAENKRLYRRYLGEGYSAEEDAFCVRKCCMEILKRMLTLLWNNIKCKF